MPVAMVGGGTWGEKKQPGKMSKLYITRVSLSRGLEHELSLLWGPVQNQILHPRGPKYGGRLRHSAL